MNNAEYIKILKRLGLTPHGKATAALLCCSMRSLAAWASGEKTVPALAARLLRLMVRLKLNPDDVSAIDP